MRISLSCASALLLITSGLAHAQGAPHGPDGFGNNYPHAGRKFLGVAMGAASRRRAEAAAGRLEPARGQDRRRSAALARANPSVTWIGHATMLVRLAGKNILFDPIFSERASPVSFAGRSASCRCRSTFRSCRPSTSCSSRTTTTTTSTRSVMRLAAMPQGSPRFLVPLG